MVRSDMQEIEDLIGENSKQSTTLSQVQPIEYHTFFFVEGIHEDNSHWTSELVQIMLICQSPQFLTFIQMMNADHPFMISDKMENYPVISMKD